MNLTERVSSARLECVHVDQYGSSVILPFESRRSERIIFFTRTVPETLDSIIAASIDIRHLLPRYFEMGARAVLRDYVAAISILLSRKALCSSLSRSGLTI